MQAGFAVLAQEIQQCISPDKVDPARYRCTGRDLISNTGQYGAQSQNFTSFGNTQNEHFAFS